MSDVQETRKLTAQHMGWAESDLGWIDEDYLSKTSTDVEVHQPEGVVDGEAALPDRFYGHNVSYRRANDGRFYYQFQSGENACNLEWFTAWQDRFDHFNQNNYCGGVVHPNKQIVMFVRR